MNTYRAGEPAMYVYRSNRTEALIDALADVVAQPPSDPFAQECLVVQGRGMERWLSLALSDRLGIWGNPSFAFPRPLLERAMASELDEPGESGAAFEAGTLTWSIAARLPGLLGDPAFAPLRGYLEDDPLGDKLVQLSKRIAETFDLYVMFRPVLLFAWEAGRDAAPSPAEAASAAWQSRLWRVLVDAHGSAHLAARMRRLIDRLDSGAGPLRDFPERVSLFGISTLPPLLLGGLAALSRRIEVHLFALSPSREYWADIRSRREQLRDERRAAEAGAAPDVELHLEEGHPLLASLGRLGRDFQAVLEAQVDYVEDGADLYREPEGARALHVVQKDMLALRRRGAGSADAPPLPLAADDESISIHACHGPMREAEVLHDRLLALFEADPSLEPRDVVVMTPDIERYAPYLEAVFGRVARPGGRAAIPARIADRSARSIYSVIDAFSRLLDVIGGRMKASEVLDLLTTDPIRERFGLTFDDAAALEAQVRDAGIRWGIDAAHREAEGQPGDVANTWRFGLDRLLLGRALSAGEPGAGVFAGRAALDAEGADAERVGRLAAFCEALFGLHARAAKPRRWPEWRDFVGDLLATMLQAEPDDAYQLQLVRSTADALVAQAARAGFEDPVSLSTLREQLDAGFRDSRPASGFMSGGVTFCEMVPMRSIPFRVVCLMGLDDAAFPRIRRPLSFDLIARHRQLGDRTSRDDDRYLFLEALMSARDHLVITYGGQDVRSNAELPASVVVGELLDGLGDAFVTGPEADDATDREAARAAVRDRLCLRHPLQPFSPRYFGADPDPRLFSHAAHHCDGARALLGDRVRPSAFVPAPLVLDEDPPTTVSIDALVAFLRNPAKAFLRDALRLYIDREETGVEDREPMDLDGLERWAIGEALLDAGAGGAPPEVVLARARARGELPLGVPGDCAFDETLAEARSLSGRVAALREGSRLDDLAVDRVLDGVRVVGTLTDLHPAGLIDARFAKLGGRSELDMWVRHLVLCWVAPPDHPRTTHMIGRPDDKKHVHVTFSPVEEPERALGVLLDAWRLGARTALPFFPKTSRKYLDTLRSSKQIDIDQHATLDAYAAWQGTSGGQRGDIEDPYFAQAFAHVDPLATDYSPTGDPDVEDGFARLAARIFGPLLEHREAMP